LQIVMPLALTLVWCLPLDSIRITVCVGGFAQTKPALALHQLCCALRISTSYLPALVGCAFCLWQLAVQGAPYGAPAVSGQVQPFGSGLRPLAVCAARLLAFVLPNVGCVVTVRLFCRDVALFLRVGRSRTRPSRDVLVDIHIRFNQCVWPGCGLGL
jgi:hypothetical protein